MRNHRSAEQESRTLTLDLRQQTTGACWQQERSSRSPNADFFAGVREASRFAKAGWNDASSVVRAPSSASKGVTSAPKGGFHRGIPGMPEGVTSKASPQPDDGGIADQKPYSSDQNMTSCKTQWRIAICSGPDGIRVQSRK
jgi:hypothetical protein